MVDDYERFQRAYIYSFLFAVVFTLGFFVADWRSGRIDCVPKDGITLTKGSP